MKMTTAVLTITIGMGLSMSMAAEPGKHPGEKVEVKSLPEAVQKTIKEKSAGGNVVKVMREDDPDGKWNYEVLAKVNGKDSKFEVDPHGTFVKQHE